MRLQSKIEWTDATWNPVTGCTKVSSGCDHCYAHTLAHGRLTAAYLRKLPVLQNDQNLRDPFAVRLWPERLSAPGKWKEARMVFVNSMSDLFHVQVPDEYVRQVFETMIQFDHHIYQVLTKRPTRAVRFFQQNRDLFPAGTIPPHIWMGTSVEEQSVVYRVDHLRLLPAQVRFLSCEPLLGALQLDLAGISWVIVGGESGVGYRPMNGEWAVDIRKQCEQAAVAFFFKQWGGRTPKAGGRQLEGQTWDALPGSKPLLLEAVASR